MSELESAPSYVAHNRLRQRLGATLVAENAAKTGLDKIECHGSLLSGSAGENHSQRLLGDVYRDNRIKRRHRSVTHLWNMIHQPQSHGRGDERT